MIDDSQKEALNVNEIIVSVPDSMGTNHAGPHHVPMKRACWAANQQIEDSETHCTTTTIDQMASVGFCPKLWKKIWAIGWSLSTSKARSPPMQNAREILIAAKNY